MRYVYLVEVLPDRTNGWKIDVHMTDSGYTSLPSFQFKFSAVRWARAYCRRRVEDQGTNKRLELQIRNRKGQIVRKDSYGTDPRSIKG